METNQNGEQMHNSLHQLGRRDFLVVIKSVSVTEFRRKPSAVWQYLETAGHIVFFTRRGKRVGAMTSIETHACLSCDYEQTMCEVEEAAAAWHEERKAERKRNRGGIII